MKHNTLSKMSLLFFSCLVLLGQLARLSTPFGKVSAFEVLMPLGCLWGGIVWWGEHRSQVKKLLQNKLLVWIIFFLAWTAVTTALNSYELAMPELFRLGGAYLARLALYILWGFFWPYILPAKQRDTNTLRLSFIAILVLQAFFGIGQYLFFPDTRILYFLGWDDHLSRAFGTLFDPSFFGALMVVGALLTVPKEKLITSKSWMQISAFAVFIVALALTYSRSTYVAFIVGVLALSWLWHQRRVLLFIPLLIMALVFLPKDGGGVGQNLLRTQSITIREEVVEIHTRNLDWRTALFGRGWYYEGALQLHRQALGVNGQISGLPENSQAVDNSFLHIFLSTGLIGSLFACGAAFEYWKLLASAQQKAVVLALAVHGFFNLTLFYPWIMLVFAALPYLF